VFYCHRCHWKGNFVTLAKELGVFRRLPSAEYRELRQRRERAGRAAQALYQRVKAWRFELLDDLHSFNRLEWQAHDAGPDHPATWDALSTVYEKRPAILAELAILENVPAAELLELLFGGVGREPIHCALFHGGVYDELGRFVEVQGL
jgi:hypothetical protein